MANLLSKFRIDYSCLKMVQITDKPRESTLQFFNDILGTTTNTDSLNSKLETTYTLFTFLFLLFLLLDCTVSNTERIALEEKTNRQLRLRELLLENSQEATLVVMLVLPSIL